MEDKASSIDLNIQKRFKIKIRKKSLSREGGQSTGILPMAVVGSS